MWPGPGMGGPPGMMGGPPGMMGGPPPGMMGGPPPGMMGGPPQPWATTPATLAAQAAADTTSMGPRKLFIGNIPQDIDEAAIHTIFGIYGRLIAIFIMHPGNSGSQAAGFVEYANPFEAATAQKTMDQKYELRPGEGTMTVRFSKPKPLNRNMQIFEDEELCSP